MSTHGLSDFVEGRDRRIERALTRAQVAQLAKPYAGFLVTRHQNMRLIGGIERHGGRDVFVWYKILLRGDPEYRSFSEYSSRVRSDFFDRSAFQQWFEEQRKVEEEAQRPVPLPDHLVPWLQPIRPIFAEDDWEGDIVFETREWVSTMGSVEQYQWREILQLVEQLELALDEPSAEAVLRRAPSGLRVKAQKTANKMIFLLGVLRPEQADDAVAPEPLPVGPDSLRHARRAYPMWLLADETMWFDIQKGTAYNLALSPEEQNLLRRVAGQTLAGSELPMFINGQAGSGKSTMLAYVFAGLCKMRLADGSGGRPLFITYNAALLEKARQTTRRILDAHHDSGKKYADVVLDDLFVSWRDYLIGLLPERERHRYSPEARVDYDDFTLAWNGHSGKLPRLNAATGDYSAETVWYVIRSLIKGSDSAGDLHPDDFAVELTRDERTVTEEMYRRIYDAFYLPWYAAALRDRDLWDDQDLTREAFDSMESRTDTNDVAALVIDEAQDFTRRELRLITRTTVYVDYEIPPTGIGVRPPIVFAGDPLQTLSPTGFRWSAVKAGIFEELQGLFGDDAPQPVFAELLNNYRSAEPIVRLANSVQLWRSTLFGIPNIQPQGAWSPSLDVGLPEKFILDEIDEEQFIRFAADTVLIVPCEEGGEIRFVRNDPTLSRMFPDASEKQPPATVFSAASIKGLEYEKIVLFKFGEAVSSDWWSTSSQSDERNLQAEYFFNKLYVAITRATHYLYVADTVAGDASLWQRFEDQAISDLLANAEARGIGRFIRDDLGTVEAGSADLEGVQEKNPRENAIRTRDYARDTRSSRKMRQAASFFRRANDRREADECEAWALQYEGEYLEAGRRFTAANKIGDAWRCFWECAAWHELGNLASVGGDLPALEAASVRYMVTESRNFDDLRLLGEAIVASANAIRSNSSWSIVVTQFCNEAQGLSRGVDKTSLGRIAEALEVLYESGHASAILTAADLWIEAGNRLQARNLLNGMTGEMTAERARLAVKVDGLPRALPALSQAGLLAEIREAWMSAGRPHSEEWLPYVVPALSDPSFASDRVRIFVEAEDYERAALEFRSHQSWGAGYQAHVESIVRGLGAAGRPRAAIDFIEDVVDMRLGRLAKPQMLTDLVTSLAQHYEQEQWKPLSPDELAGLRDAVEIIYRDLRFDRLKPEHVPSLGVVLEMAKYPKWAGRLYQRFSDSRDPALREYCRRRFLASVTERLKEGGPRGADRAELQAMQHEHATRWGLEVNQTAHQKACRVEATAPPTTETTARGEGSIGAVAWKYDASVYRLDVTVEDDTRDLLAVARVYAKEGKSRITGGSLTESPAGFQLIVEDQVVVDVNVAADIEVVVHDAGIELGRAVVARLVVPTSERATKRPSRSSRTTQAGGIARERVSPGALPGRVRAGVEGQGARGGERTIRVHKLALDLGKPVPAVTEACRTLGLGAKRGDARLTAAEARAVREHFAVDGPKQ